MKMAYNRNTTSSTKHTSNMKSTSNRPNQTNVTKPNYQTKSNINNSINACVRKIPFTCFKTCHVNTYNKPELIMNILHEFPNKIFWKSSPKFFVRIPLKITNNLPITCFTHYLWGRVCFLASGNGSHDFVKYSPLPWVQKG